MEPGRLTRLLIERKLVERFTIDQVLVKLEHGQTLADRLVQDGVLGEADLLRAIAQATNTRFISSSRLAGLKVSQEVLELVPHEIAEELDAIPFAVNVPEKTLALVIADPARVPALDKVPRVARMDVVVVNVALPGAIRAAIKRLYRKGGLPAYPVPSSVCPQCGEPTFDEQLECGRCGLLLNAGASTGRTDSRIVRALLSIPTGTHPMPSRDSVHDGPTHLGLPLLVTDEQIPELVAGVDIAGSLAELDAFLVSFIDGALTVGALAQAAGLMSIEVRSVVASLVNRKVLRLRDTTVPTIDPGPEPAIDPAKERKRRTQPARQAPAPAPLPPTPAAKSQGPLRAGPIDAPQPLSPQAQMENSLQHALALERRGKVTGAISVLRVAIARAPSPAPLYNRLALVVLNQRRDVKQAEQLIQKAIELDPGNRVYRQNLARVLILAASKGRA